MNYKEFVQSKTFRNVLIGLCAAIVALMIFQAGMFIGYREAAFSYGWGENYYQAFGERPQFPGGFPREMFTEANGAVGKIVKINLPTVVVADNSGIEKSVVLSDDTAVRQFRQNVPAASLQVGEYVAVLGSPNSQSQIEATLIRVLPPPPTSGAPSSATTSIRQ